MQLRARVDVATNLATFGALLRHLRIRARLSQRDLAIAVGYSESQISRLEQQQRQPDPDIVRMRFVAALDLDDAPELALQLVALAEAAKEPPKPDDSALPAPPQSLSRSSVAPPISRVPVPLTPLINRVRELDAISTLLQRPNVRLLTLVGPPGIGKTRLSLQAAELCAVQFADGAVFVPLVSVRDPAQVIAAIARALGCAESDEHALYIALHDSELLLVLDNFEQVTAAGPQIAALLRMAPHIKALVTSRSPLQVSGEHQYAVPPLELPDLRALPPLDILAAYPALQLFTERMRALRPDFKLTVENVATVVEVCVQLDGLPLAIELAVARSKLFTPATLLERLRRSSALTFLVDGPRDLLVHQQTLRSTIDWSYDLLAPTERMLFTHLGVFVGGYTAEAAAAVCGAGCGEVEQTLEALVHQSLLTFEVNDAGVVRFGMLETIREYALEKLVANVALARCRHATYYAALVAAAVPHLTGAAQDRWLNQLQAEEPNIEAALGWFVEHDVAAGLQCAANLHQFWVGRGFVSEGRAWFVRLLNVVSAQWTAHNEHAPRAADAPPASTAGIAQALQVAGALALEQGDLARADVYASASLRLHRTNNDQHGLLAALMALGRVAFGQGQYTQARASFTECLALAKQLGDQLGAAQMFKNLALIAKDEGQYAQAIALHNDALAIYRRLEHRRGIAQSLINLSIVAYWQGEFGHAERFVDEGLKLHRQLGDRMGLAYALDMAGMVAYKQGDYVRALGQLSEGLRLFRALNEQVGTAMILNDIGVVAQAQGAQREAAAFQREGLLLAHRNGDRRRVAFCLEGLAATLEPRQALLAARLFGAAEALRATLGTPLPLSERRDHDANVAAARTHAESAQWTAAWVAGSACSLAALVEELAKD